MQTNFRSLIEGTAEYPVAFVSSAAFFDERVTVGRF